MSATEGAPLASGASAKAGCLACTSLKVLYDLEGGAVTGSVPVPAHAQLSYIPVHKLSIYDTCDQIYQADYAMNWHVDPGDAYAMRQARLKCVNGTCREIALLPIHVCDRFLWMKLEVGGDEAVLRWRQSEAILGGKCWKRDLVTPICHSLQGLTTSTTIVYIIVQPKSFSKTSTNHRQVQPDPCFPKQESSHNPQAVDE